MPIEKANAPLHHHPNDGSYYPECKRCQIEHAAPDLLAACKVAFADCIGDDWANSPLAIQLQKAIDKAEGSDASRTALGILFYPMK